MPFSLSYLAPPFLGAFIGYATNYVAIRMLFRPLKPWRLFGLRLPLTPGVIPAKRRELAENIGEMVGGHLLTSADVGRALTEQGFQNELRELLEQRVENLLHRELGPVADLIPARFRSYFEMGVKVMRLRFLEHLHAHLNGKAFADSLSPSISQQLNEFLNAPASGILPPERLEHLYAFLETTTARFLAGPGVQEWLTAYINKAVDDFLSKNGSIKDLLPEKLADALLDKMAEETPNMLARLAELLKDPLVQARIAKTISAAANKFAASMGPVISIISNFISPQKIERKIRDYLAENSESISQWLFDPTVQAKVAAVLRDKTATIIATPLKSWLQDVDEEKLQQARQWLITRLVAALRNPEVAKSITRLLGDGLETQYHRSLHDILTDLFGTDGLNQSSEWLTNEFFGIIRSPKVKRLIDDLVSDMVARRLLKQPIGTLAGFLPREVQEGIADYLLQQLSDILVREVPGLVDSLNISELVADKVDTLDLLRLEGLLLGIMQEQFKYINLFGGLLGFIIGLVNLVFIVGQ